MGQFDWAQAIALIKALGLVRGVFVIFFFVAHGVIFALYNGRMKDRQKDIERLAAENKEYRDRFTALLDRKLRVPKHLLPSSTQKKKRKGRGS